MLLRRLSVALLGIAGGLSLSLAPAVAPARTAGLRDGSSVGNGVVAFATNRDHNYEIYAVNSDGSGQADLTNSPASDTSPAWSPDGTRIAFTTNRDGNSEVYVMQADGSGQANLTNDPGSDTSPAWSPDQGTRIVFTTDRTGNSEIEVMDANGSYPTDITHASSADSRPSWQPLVAPPPSGSPIRHVVVLYQENHSFDNVLGKLCADAGRCDGATQGELDDGTIIALEHASDIVPFTAHDGISQVTASGRSRLGRTIPIESASSQGQRYAPCLWRW